MNGEPNKTHDPEAKSWVESATALDAEYPIAFRKAMSESPN